MDGSGFRLLIAVRRVGAPTRDFNIIGLFEPKRMSGPRCRLDGSGHTYPAKTLRSTLLNSSIGYGLATTPRKPFAITAIPEIRMVQRHFTEHL